MVKVVLSLEDLDGSNGFSINGEHRWDNSGGSVSAAGDLNGDGIDDIIVGAAGAGDLDTGASYVIFGDSNWLNASIELSELDGSNGFKINGIGKDDNSGGSVSGAGDVNGDGIDDIVIGAAGAIGGDSDDESYVIFGENNWSNASIDLSDLDGSNGFKITGIKQGSSSGLSVSSAGDVNGDNIDDIIIGAAGADANNKSAAGESYVIYGSQKPFSSSIDISELDGTIGFRITGINDYDASGVSVSYAGDVNGDNIDDIIIGAYNADKIHEQGTSSEKIYLGAGATYVVFGDSEFSSSSIDLSSLDGENGFRIDGIDEFDRSGKTVSNAGDINGDNIDDIIIGAYLADSGGHTNAGQSYVVFGANSWPDPFIELHALDGSNGFKVNGLAQSNFNGSSVSYAGDVNGDNIDDIIVGAAGTDWIGKSEVGASYVIFGAENWSLASIDLSLLDSNDGIQIIGFQTDGWAGGSVSNAGDVNGDGFSDLIIGAKFADTHDSLSSAGQSYVVFGQSFKGTVKITGTATEGQVLTATKTLYNEDIISSLSYQWKADGAVISDATFSTFTLTQSEVDKAITVSVSYLDDEDTAEIITSAATSTVTNVNDVPTGTVSITGEVAKNKDLTAVSTVVDEDGLGTLSYQWKADGIDIPGATSSTFTLAESQIGRTITVTISYIDGGGTLESVTSAATSAVMRGNNLPTGEITISGTASQGNDLTAVTTALADEDGLGTLSYQWLRDGEEISRATSSTYALIETDVGSTVSVLVSYTDGFGSDERIESLTTSAVTQENTDPTGEVTISGTASQGNDLTAVTTALADEDGLGTLSYQWTADGIVIPNATASTLTLGQTEVGKEITVSVSYTDDGGTAQSVTSVATSAVTQENTDPTGEVTISGTASQGNDLTAVTTALADEDGLGTLSYQWTADGVVIPNATASILTLSQSEVGKEITVSVSYTDDGGTAQSVTSVATSAVINVNDDPTGEVTISGTASQGNDLTAVTTALADEDGLGTLSYQWTADGVVIPNATASILTLSQSEVGKEITVSVSYTDDGGTAQSVTSVATSAVINVNDDPTGEVTISGTASQGNDLTAVTTALADEDGLGTLSYQWTADGVVIPNATASILTLSQSEVGKEITVSVSYTDDGGTAQSVTSVATSAVINVNDDPTGEVTISGTASQGNDLTAVTTALADEDGLGTLSYQWLRDGEEISRATSSTYALIETDVGSTVSVLVSYTDDFGSDESIESLTTSAVTQENTNPTGEVTISGTPSTGSRLTAVTTSLADADGSNALPANGWALEGADGDLYLSYQWKADGIDIPGATSSTFTLAESQIGRTITVTISYIDGGGTLESVTSAATSAVMRGNNLPTGEITISGTASQGNDLTAVTTALADEDGLGTLSYQWLRDGEEISRATSSTYALIETDVGSTVSVLVSYTDGFGSDESIESLTTSAVTQENTDPTGEVTISGTASQGNDLTAVTTALADEDGLGTLSYQWTADGIVIPNATASTLTLGQTEVGKEITVSVSYTDDGGTAQSVTSVATSAVMNVNDDPTGEITISGTASQGNDLTAVTTALADEDGLGTLSYQWLRDGEEISGATSESYELGENDGGEIINVKVTYTDKYGTNEEVSSISMDEVNFKPTLENSLTNVFVREGEEKVSEASGKVFSDEDGDTLEI